MLFARFHGFCKEHGRRAAEDHWQDPRGGRQFSSMNQFSPVILNTVHTFPIYAEFSSSYPELERRNVTMASR